MADAWIGTSSGDWNNSSNWSKGVVPGSRDDYGDDVSIDTGTLQYIDLPNTDNADFGYEIGALTVGGSDEVTLVSGRMIVGGAITTPGSLDVDQGFELDLEGRDDTQTIDNTGTIFVAGTLRPGAGDDATGTVVLTGGGQLDLFGGSIEGISFSGIESNNDIYGTGSISVESLQNDAGGIIQAQGGELSIQTFTAIQNYGEIGATATNSTIDLQASVDNLGSGSIVATASGAQVIVDAGTVTGGVLATSDDGTIVGQEGSVLDGTTMTGAFEAQGYEGFLLDGDNAISNSAYFELSSGGSFFLEGGRILSDGNAAELINAATLFGTGQLGDGMLNLDNRGTIKASGGALSLPLSASDIGTNYNESGAEIVAGANATLSMGTGDPNGSTFENDGSLIAYAGGSLVIGQGVAMTNLQGSDLVGGIYEAEGKGALVELNGYFSTLDATAILSGAGSSIVSNDESGGPTKTLGAMLSTIAKGGVLEVVGGRNFETILPSLTIGGTLEVSNGTFRLGGAAREVVVRSGGRIALVAGGGIDRAPGSKGHASVDKGGRLEKLSGGGTSAVDVAVANDGTVIAGSGVLDFGAAVNGTGHDYVEKGATLAFAGAVAGTQAVAFATGGGKLLLADAGQFAGSVAKLGAGDAVDVDGLGSGTTFSFVENAGKTMGVLTLKHGSTVDKLMLVGSYASSGFKLTTGTSGDTLVRYAPSKAQGVPAADASPSHAAVLTRLLCDAMNTPACSADAMVAAHLTGLESALAVMGSEPHGFG